MSYECIIVFVHCTLYWHMRTNVGNQGSKPNTYMMWDVECLKETTSAGAAEML